MFGRNLLRGILVANSKELPFFSTFEFCLVRTKNHEGNMEGNVGGKKARQLIRLRILDKRKEKKALKLLQEASSNWTALQQVPTYSHKPV